MKQSRYCLESSNWLIRVLDNFYNQNFKKLASTIKFLYSLPMPIQEPVRKVAEGAMGLKARDLFDSSQTVFTYFVTDE